MLGYKGYQHSTPKSRKYGKIAKFVTLSTIYHQNARAFAFEVLLL